MDRFFYILGLLLAGYIIGIIFGNRSFSFLKRFIRFKAIYEYGDIVFLAVAFVVVFTTFFYFWILESNLPDAIQLGIFLATFFTLFYSVLIKDIPSKYRSRPKVKVLFDTTKTDYYHRTTMNIFEESNGSRRIIARIPTYYIRLKVKNDGVRTLKNVEAVLESVKPKTDKPFMSLNLNWAGFNVPPNDIKRSVDIPQGQSRTLDVFEFMEFPSTRILYDDRIQKGDPEAERYKELAEGFRSCTIKPLTHSDIYPRGSYLFKLGIYADGVKPEFIEMPIEYNGNWTESTSIDEMRTRHLVVSLES